MLTDDVTIKVKAGDGGNGVVRFSKTMMVKGPTGGSGGKGGSVILRGVSDLGALRPFRTTKKAVAQRGEDGQSNTKHGADGMDKIIPIPVGTVAHDLTHNKSYDITHVGQDQMVVEGGNGGFGNHHFRSSRNTTPMRANAGLKGNEIDLRLELKMIADIGFIGYPNVGKSTLLNTLTNASSKVANYQFTTLEPHLGVYNELILADIPGLIEGASEGKGLGHKFLQHIERTRALFHFVAADSEDPIADYAAIRSELDKFSDELSKKDEWIIISRSDNATPEKLQEIKIALAKENERVFTLSVLDDGLVSDIRTLLADIERNYKTQAEEE